MHLLLYLIGLSLAVAKNDANAMGPNNFTEGLTLSLTKEKFDEAKDVYFDMILNSILAGDWSYIDFGNNQGFAMDNTFMILARSDESEFEFSV
jgi:hypothetical protein